MQTQTNNSKIILVTGSNKGIGFAIIKRLLETHSNYRVILTSRDETKGRESFNKLVSLLNITEEQDRLFYHQLDITDQKSLKNCISWIKDKFNQIDILVANAGVFSRDKSLIEAFTETFTTNVFATINSTEKFIDEDIIAKNGKIVLLGSTMGSLASLKNEALKEEFRESEMTNDKLFSLAERYKQAIINNTLEKEGWIECVYSVSKMIVNTYAKVLAKRKEITDRNIGVYAVHPGWVQTDMGGQNALLTVDEGIATPLYAIELEDGIHPEFQGKYFDQCKVSSFEY